MNCDFCDFRGWRNITHSTFFELETGKKKNTENDNSSKGEI